MLVGDRHRRVAGEGRPAGQQLVEQAAGRVQVAARVHPLAPGLLRRQVLGGTDDLRGLGHGQLRVGHGPGNAEVHHLDVAVAGEHHVAGLDVAVHDAVAVAVVQCPQHAVGDLGRALGQQPPVVAEQVAQRAPVDELHHDVRDGRAAHHVLAGVVDGHDGRVVQRGRGLRLAAEPGLECLVAGQVVAERLHADNTVKTDVAGPEDFGHAAPPDDAVELVAAAQKPWLSHISHLRYRPACRGLRAA